MKMWPCSLRGGTELVAHLIPKLTQRRRKSYKHHQIECWVIAICCVVCNSLIFVLVVHWTSSMVLRKQLGGFRIRLGGSISFGCLSPSAYYQGSNYYLILSLCIYLTICSIARSMIIGYAMNSISGSCLVKRF